MRGKKPQKLLRALVLADANERTGLGHLMRTRALVEALRERRVLEATYLGRFGSREAAWIRGWGYGAQSVPGSDRTGVLRRSLQRVQPDLLIFDAYRVLEPELRLAQGSGVCTILFDDLRKAGKVPVTLRVSALEGARTGPPPRDAARHLVGLRYLCVRPEIAKKARRARKRKASTCIVSLGGGRTARLRPLVSRLAHEVPIRRWVVLGPQPGLRAERHPSTARVGGTRPLRIVSRPKEVAEALAGATVAVSAAGTTAWELACLGVPTVLWPRVQNQQPIARALDRRAAHACRRWQDLPQALAQLVTDPSRLERLSRGGRRLVDGLGAQRVAAAVLQRRILATNPL